MCGQRKKPKKKTLGIDGDFGGGERGEGWYEIKGCTCMRLEEGIYIGWISFH